MLIKGETLLTLVKQPTDNSCTSACLAMLTGLPIETVMSEFHDDWIAGTDRKHNNPYIYLKDKGMSPKLNKKRYGAKLKRGNAHLLTVPSLNVEAITHHILLMFSLTENVPLTIYDPSKLRCYNFKDVGPDLKSLKSFEIDLYVPLDNLPLTKAI